MIKAIGSADCTITELVRLTVEDVMGDKILVFRDGSKKYIKIPNGVRQELLIYVARGDITSGRIF